jgi:hypothetical protein
MQMLLSEAERRWRSLPPYVAEQWPVILDITRKRGRSGVEPKRSEGAPVPGPLETRCEATDTLGFWPFCSYRRVDLDGRGVAGAARALAVLAAAAHLLPFAELCIAAVACTLQLSLRMEQGMFVESDLPLRVLPAEDATTLATVMATVEEAKGGLAGRCSADWSRTIRLPVVPCDWPYDWRERDVAVDAIQILSRNTRESRSPIAWRLSKSTTGAPAAVGRVYRRVDLWW